MNHPGSPWHKEPESIGLWEVLGCVILSKTSTSVISMTVVTMWGVQHYSHCTVTAADMQKWNPGTNTGVHEWELAWKHTYLTPPNRAFSGAVEEQTGEMTARHCQEQTAGVKTPQNSFLPALEGNTRQRPWVSTGRLGLRSVRRHNAAHSRPSPRGLELALRSLLLTVWPLFLLCSVRGSSQRSTRSPSRILSREIILGEEEKWMEKANYFWHSVLGALVAIVLWARSS